MLAWLSVWIELQTCMPLPLSVSCFSKIQIGFTFLVPAYPSSPGKRVVKQVHIKTGRGYNNKLWRRNSFADLPSCGFFCKFKVLLKLSDLDEVGLHVFCRSHRR